jgi:hypothetical protein
MGKLFATFQKFFAIFATPATRSTADTLPHLNRAAQDPSDATKNNPISALALPCLAFGPIRILSPPDGLPKGPPAPLLLLSALRRFSPEFPSLATFSSHGDAEAAPGAPQDPSSRRRAGPLHREGCRCRRRRRQPHRQVDAGTYPPSSPRSPASRFRSALAS